MKKKWMALLLTAALLVLPACPAFAAACVFVPELNSVPLLEVGETFQLTATLGPANVTDGMIWTSDTPAVATVTRGTVKAVGPGNAIVTATTGDGRSARSTVRVAAKGIDVSTHQGAVSWGDVKNAGIGFALLRAGYGDEASQADETFSTNYDGAVAAGMKVGAYYLSYATTAEDAVQEANVCLGILAGRRFDYPVFYDIDPNVKGHEDQAVLSPDQLSAIAAAFCNTIKNAGYRAGLYSNTDSLNKRLTGSALSSYDKWVAHYDVPSPNYAEPYTLWQYSEKGTVNGIAGDVDLDYSFVDYPNAAPAASDISLLSDSPATITLQRGKTYTIKFIPNGISGTPSFASGNSSVLKILSQTKSGGCWYVKISAASLSNAKLNAMRAAGANSTSLYSQLSGKKAVRRCVVTVS